MSTLYLVATPIGNLEDITLRALRVLKEVTLIATEDTRTTGKLLSHFEMRVPLISYHEHSKPQQLARIMEALTHGDVALVSEAGTPLLSDPGYRLVQTAWEQDHTVVSIPGASAPIVALTASGLPTDQFFFMGFLPRKANARRQMLQTVQSQPATLICFESPHRLVSALQDMANILGDNRPIALCRELTKLHEEIWRGTIGEAVNTWSNRDIRGEFTVVIGGAPEATAWTQAEIETALRTAQAEGLSTRDAVQAVLAQSNWAKRDIYRLAQVIYGD